MTKSSKLTAALLAAALCIVSCQQRTEADLPDAPQAEAGTVYREFQAGCAGVKASLSGFPDVSWQDSDALAVWDGSYKRTFLIKEGTNTGSSATFQGTVTDGATSFWTVFPASAFAGFSDGRFTAEVPAVQEVASGACNAAGATVAVGKVGNDNRVSLINVTGLLKVTIGSNYNNTISSLTLHSAGGEAVAGTAVFDALTGTLTGIESPSSSVTLKAQDGGTLAAGNYYISLLPTSLEKGFTLEFRDADGKGATVSTANPMTLVRNGGFNLGTVTTGLGEFGNLIMTADDLVEWNQITSFPADATYKLGADIDMTGRNWTPRSNFTGTFDGQGHRIYNFVVETNEYSGFIRTTKEESSAVIRNLVIGSKDGESWDGVSRFRHSNSANNYTWYYVGVVGKTMGATDISNVTNFSAIEVDASSTGKTRIGGICGSWTSSGTMSGCVNYGSITNYSEVTGVTASGGTTAAPGGLGGMAAQCDNTGIITGCTNYGTITNCNKGTNTIGGILSNSSYACTVSNCHNYGKIVCKETYTGSSTYVGGILGYGNGVVVADCTNHQDLGWSVCRNVVCGGGVLGYLATGTASGCVNYGKITVTKGTNGNWASFAGVAAAVYTGGTLSDCHNHGEVNVYYAQTVRVAGVCGTLNNGAYVRDCTNDATVTLSLNAGNNRWAGVAGICGFQEKTADSRVNEVSGCTNSGKVYLKGNYTVNSSPHANGASAAGIIGYACLSINVNDNINNGAVSAVNSSPAPFNAGGIIGHAAKGANVRTNRNVNNASVSCSTSNNSELTAGGVVGLASISSYIANGDKNYGAVTGGVASRCGSVAGYNTASLTNCGAGGSVNGTALTSGNFSSYVQGSASTGTHTGSSFVTK